MSLLLISTLKPLSWVFLQSMGGFTRSDISHLLPAINVVSNKTEGPN